MDQGQIWWATADGQRRPVLVVTRGDVIPFLRRVVVAPVTRTVRGIPTEVPLGPDDGLAVECCASFDNLQPIDRRLLTEPAGRLAPERRPELCRALRALADC
ncbi:type II toxin-antitoxin system PemK/MazF family toxin [Patulibacter sp. S7RM1-6]